MRVKTKYFNDLGDELVVVSGVADNGEEGYFIAESYFREATQKQVTHPLVFYKDFTNAKAEVAYVASNYDFKRSVA